MPAAFGMPGVMELAVLGVLALVVIGGAVVIFSGGSRRDRD